MMSTEFWKKLAKVFYFKLTIQIDGSFFICQTRNLELAKAIFVANMTND